MDWRPVALIAAVALAGMLLVGAVGNHYHEQLTSAHVSSR